MTDDLPPGFAPWPPTEAEALAMRSRFKVTGRQVAVLNNRLRVLLGAQRTEEAREARRTQGDATAVLILSALEQAPAGKLEAAVKWVCARLGVDRATVFRALARRAALSE